MWFDRRVMVWATIATSNSSALLQSHIRCASDALPQTQAPQAVSEASMNPGQERSMTLNFSASVPSVLNFSLKASTAQMWQCLRSAPCRVSCTIVSIGIAPCHQAMWLYLYVLDVSVMLVAEVMATTSNIDIKRAAHAGKLSCTGSMQQASLKTVRDCLHLLCPWSFKRP